MLSSGLALTVLVALLALTAGAGVWYARGRLDSLDDFVTARNTTATAATTATLVASVLGGWILFSPAEAGAAFGGVGAVVGYGLGSAVAMALYMLVAPRIRELMPRGRSLTEYAWARYGPAMYAFVLLVSLSYMFIFLAANLTGIGAALSLLAGVPAWLSATLLGVAVLAYTAYGGLKASIFTDKLQALVLVPLLLLLFGAALVALGGPAQVHASVSRASPDLVDPLNPGAVEFALFVVLAIVGAELLNQTWWQRTYAAQDAPTARRSFGLTALLVLPLIVAVGLFGVAAAGLGLVGPGEADVSLFVLVQQSLPAWAELALLVLAVLLVSSTMDTLLNAITSLVTSDLPRLAPSLSEAQLTAGARIVTVVAAAGAIAIAAQDLSVLALFLAADLFAAATAFPLLYGLWARRSRSWTVLAPAVAGLVAGVALFPPARALVAETALGSTLPAPSFLWAFAAAAGLSAAGTVVLSRAFGREVDLAVLARRTDQPHAAEQASDRAPATGAEGDAPLEPAR